MSALGQKQTFRSAIVMSALPLEADMCGAKAKVRFVPRADIGTLFDHLVGARRCNGAGHVQAERLGGLQVDDRTRLSWPAGPAGRPACRP